MSEEPRISMAIHPKFSEENGHAFSRIIEKIGSLGIKYLELPWKNWGNSLRIQTALQKGFGVTLHLDMNWYCSKYQDDYWLTEHFSDLADTLCMWGAHERTNPIILNIHPVDSTDVSSQQNMFTTVMVLNKLQKIISKVSKLFQLCVENLPFKKNQSRFGYDFKRLVELMLDCQGIKFTLDIGHYAQSIFLGQSKEIPPQFLDGVAHIHIHDYHPEWGDHLPLGKGIVSLEIIKSLIKGGYRGIFCLELHNMG